MKTLSEVEWERFSAKDGECLVWIGSRDREGYGRVWLAGVNNLVHVLVWEDCHGPVPNGKEVCHTCDNPPCFRQEHLYTDTHQKNMEIAARKERMCHKLTLADVRTIRELAKSGVTRIEIAKMYPVVTYWTICDILNGRSRRCA